MQSLVTFKVHDAKVSNAIHILNVRIQPTEQENILILHPLFSNFLKRHFFQTTMPITYYLKVQGS